MIFPCAVLDFFSFFAARLAQPAYGYLFFRSTFFLYWLVGRLVGRLVGLSPKFIDNGSQPSINGSPRNLVWGQS